MLTAKDIALYFLAKDTEHELFTKKLVEKNDRTFYSGNARLNKYLHLAQNIYIAKTGRKLFSDDMYAYDNGAVVPDVQENYAILLNNRVQTQEIPSSIKLFLDKVYIILETATLDELIELSHEDSEWQEKSHYYKKESQKMDSLSHLVEYKKQYDDILQLMEHIN